MNVITNIQREILSLFGEVSDSEQFYLTGGTALAEFYLKHRRSNDLDFFTSIEELINPFSDKLRVVLEKKGMSVKKLRTVHSFIELTVDYGDEMTAIHLAQDSSFRFEPLKTFQEYPNLKVDSLVDMASNKLLALFGRAVLRDFIDIYFLVKKKNFVIKELMDKANIKDPGFDLYWFGVALERIKTFKNDSPDMYLLIEHVDFQDLLNFFNNWRKDVGEKLK